MLLIYRDILKSKENNMLLLGSLAIGSIIGQIAGHMFTRKGATKIGTAIFSVSTLILIAVLFL